MGGPALKRRVFFIYMATRNIIPVPFEIASSMELSWQQKFIMAEIVYLHRKKGCFAKQKHFCNILNINADVCSRVFKKLTKSGFIQRTNDMYVPLKFVDQKSTDDLTKSQHNQKSNLDQKSTGLDQKSTEHHIVIEDNKEESALNPEIENNVETSKDKKTNINKQKFAPSKEQMLYAVMASMDRIHLNSTMTDSELRDLDKLFYEIRTHLEDLKKNIQKLPSWNISQAEVMEHFKSFCKNLDDYTKNNNFTTKYLRFNYAHLRKKQEQSRKVSKPAKQEFKFYTPKNKKKSNE